MSQNQDHAAAATIHGDTPNLDQKIRARTLKSQLFHSVHFQVGGLTEIAGVHPVAEVFYPNTSVPGAEGRVRWDTEAARQHWRATDGDDLALTFTPTWNHDGYSFTMTSLPTVTISTTEPQTAQWWLDRYVRPLAEITSLSTLQDQPPSWVMLSHGEREFPVQLFAADINQEPYDAARPAPGDLINGRSGLIQLGPSGLSLPDLLERWRALAVQHPTFHEYVTISVRRGMTMRPQFVSVVSALEGFHTTSERDDEEADARFERRRAAVIAEVEVAKERAVISAESARLVKKHLRSQRPPKPLDQRLREIATKELSEGLARRIEQRFPAVPDSLKTFAKSDSWDIWSVVAEIRNRMAHGDGLQPPAAGLAKLSYLTNTVAVGLVLNQLGVGDEILCDAIDEQQWQVR